MPATVRVAEGRGQPWGAGSHLPFMLGIKLRLPGLHMWSHLAAPDSKQQTYNEKRQSAAGTCC